jgi:RHS repeat-associated protein
VKRIVVSLFAGAALLCGLMSVAHAYGNRIDYGPNDYQHSAGLGLQLARAAGRQSRSEQQLDSTTQLVTERRYDSADRQVAIAHSKQSASATTLVAGQAIARGQGGAVSRIDSFDGTASFDATTGAFIGSPSRVQAFGYDANQRLTSEHEYKGAQLSAFLADANAQATQATTYAYDAVGNRISKTVTTPAGTESTSYSYDTNDRLTGETLTTATGSTVATTYTWDGNGNLASKTTPSEYTGYIFDADNRMVEVRRGTSAASATSIARYGYDADGQRIRKETPSGTTHYLIDPTTTWPQVALEIQGAQRTAYVWGNELRQQARGAAGAVATALTEDLMPLQGHLGTTIAAVDRAGNIVERYEASAFGEPVNASPRAMHQYTGEYWDQDSQLVYLRERWYDPKATRLLSLDPAMGKPSDPRTATRYSYASADPANNVDPSGAFTLGEVGSGLSASLNLALRAYNAYDLVNSMFAPSEEDDRPDRKATLWDGLMAEVIRSAFGSASSILPNASALASLGAIGGSLRPRHHTIPEYMCGASAQERVLLRFADHSRLHTQLYGLHLSVKVVLAKAYELLFRKRNRGEALSPIATVAGTSLGRYAIGEGLHAFYESEGYWAMGFSERGPTFGSLGNVFLRERARYVRNHHS